MSVQTCRTQIELREKISKNLLSYLYTASIKNNLIFLNIFVNYLQIEWHISLICIKKVNFRYRI